jgi:hypothetical protein
MASSSVNCRPKNEHRTCCCAGGAIPYFPTSRSLQCWDGVYGNTYNKKKGSPRDMLLDRTNGWRQSSWLVAETRETCYWIKRMAALQAGQRRAAQRRSDLSARFCGKTSTVRVLAWQQVWVGLGVLPHRTFRIGQNLQCQAVREGTPERMPLLTHMQELEPSLCGIQCHPRV